MHPERRVTLDSIRYGDVLSHPLSEKVYGKPKPTAALLSSIEKVGILQALVVNETSEGKFELLVGNTRREAWRLLYEQKRVKTQWIPCKFVQLSPIEAEQMVLESNLQRVKTKEQEAREYREKLRIEKMFAKYRQSLRVNLPQDSKGKARDIAAKGLSMSGSTAERLLTVVEAADHGDKAARAALKAVNAGGSVDAAYKSSEASKEHGGDRCAEQSSASIHSTVQSQGHNRRSDQSKRWEVPCHAQEQNRRASKKFAVK